MITTLSPAGSFEAAASAPGPVPGPRGRVELVTPDPAASRGFFIRGWLLAGGPQPPNYTMPATDRRTTHSSAAGRSSWSGRVGARIGPR